MLQPFTQTFSDKLKKTRRFSQEQKLGTGDDKIESASAERKLELDEWAGCQLKLQQGFDEEIGRAHV